MQRQHITAISAAALESRQSFLQALLVFLFACVVLQGHFMLGASFGLAGYIWLVAIMAMSLFVSIELAYTLLMIGMFLQNMFICLVVPTIDDASHYSALLGTSFVLALVAALIGIPAWLKYQRSLPPGNAGLLRWLIFFMIVVGIYSGLGLLAAKPMSVMMYARCYMMGGLLLMAGVAMGFQLTIAYATAIIRLLTVVLAAWALCEYFITYDLYSFFHIPEFLSFKFINRADPMVFTTVSDAIDFDNHAYLNLSGDYGLNIDILRLKGPNIHSISYSYALLFCCLVCFMQRAWFLTAVSFILVMLVGAKGCIVMMLVSFGLYALYKYTRNTKIVLTAMLGLILFYIVGCILYGLHTRDYHIIGFLGGLNGFIHNPIGHGIGVGGSLSENMQGASDQESMLKLFQNLGATFAFESGMGVMMYQMGIGTLVFLAFYYRFWKLLWKAAIASPEPRLLVMPFATAFLLINSLFQEEAFSPIGWGLWMFYGGMLITQHGRQIMAQQGAIVLAQKPEP